jgi:hypothetical protein
VALSGMALRGCIPLDFISCVQKWTSSWISSGATSLRDHDSSQRGLGAGWELGSALELLREASFDLKTFLKKGMLGERGSLHVFALAGGSGQKYRCGRGVGRRV